ncbi:hypothetical protein EP7_001466 [Isosphaeraceae bacterium EP7]
MCRSRGGRFKAGLIAVACLAVSGCSASTTNDVVGKEEGTANPIQSQADYFKQQQEKHAKGKVKAKRTPLVKK